MKNALILLIVMGVVFSGAIDETATAHAKVLEYQETLQTDAMCKRMMGLDKQDCFDYDSCQKACYAATSFCMPIALDVGKPMIYDVWKYQNRSKKIEDALFESEIKYQTFIASPNQQSFANYEATLQPIVDADNSFSMHKFHGWLCNESAHNKESLIEAQSVLNSVDIIELDRIKIYEEDDKGAKDKSSDKSLIYANEEDILARDDEFERGLVIAAIVITVVLILISTGVFLFVSKKRAP